MRGCGVAAMLAGMARHQDNDHPSSPELPLRPHGLHPGRRGRSDVADPRDRADVARWRQAARQQLVNERLAIPDDLRPEWNARICVNLEEAIRDAVGLTISAYSPIRGEPDLHQFLERAVAHGASMALPVVIADGQPLIFRSWTVGQALERGVWDVPVPAVDADVVVPDIVIAPVVGFDSGCYRLGYGGGLFDRTLAAMPTRPHVVGVGYQKSRIDTIHPQPHDIPMDVIVTEHGLLACGRPSAPRTSS